MAAALATAPTNNIVVAGGGHIGQGGGSVDTQDLTTNSSLTDGYDQGGGTFRLYHDYKGTGTFYAVGGTFEVADTGGGNAFSSTGQNFWNDVVIDSGATAKFDQNVAMTINVVGNWTNNGTANLTGRATTVVFSGNSAQTIGGTTPTTFNNLTVNEGAGSLALGQDATVAGTLAFNTGNLQPGGSDKLTTGSNTLTSGTTATTGSVSGAGAEHRLRDRQPQEVRQQQRGTVDQDVRGRHLQLLHAADDHASGEPEWTNAASALTVSSTAGEHPSINSSGIDPFKDVNSYWSVISWNR